jgi:membrane-associated phospholipid phosphatase
MIKAKKTNLLFSRFSVFYIFLILSVYTLNAKSFSEISGDILLVTVPLSTYGYIHYINDKEGKVEFYKSLASTIVLTYGLKKIINKKRPDGSDSDSFPSAHTSLTFQSSAFIDRRYGFKYAILPYILSSYVGYTRVDSKKHYTIDVFAGAIIGIACSYFFTNKNIYISTDLSKNEKIVFLGYRW